MGAAAALFLVVFLPAQLFRAACSRALAAALVVAAVAGAGAFWVAAS